MKIWQFNNLYLQLEIYSLQHLNRQQNPITNCHFMFTACKRHLQKLCFHQHLICHSVPGRCLPVVRRICFWSWGGMYASGLQGGVYTPLGRHPPQHYGIQSTSGRHASYCICILVSDNFYVHTFIFSSGSVIAEPTMDIYGNTNEKNLNIVSVLRIFLFNLKSCLLCGLHGKEFGSLCNKSLPIQREAHTEFLVGAGAPT